MINLYLDGQAKPALSMPFVDFLNGRFLPVREPFAKVTGTGYNLHFPIVHARHCKLTVSAPRPVDLAQLYYQVSWQSLPNTAQVHEFNLGEIEKQADELKAIRLNWTAISRSITPRNLTNTTSELECLVNPGEAIKIFGETGSRAITDIRFTGKSKSDLSGLFLHGFWDGQALVETPLQLLAGVSSKLEETESLPATVRGTTLLLRWFMPFEQSGELVVSNTTSQPCRFKVEIWSQAVNPVDFPMRFHARYEDHRGLRPLSGTCLTLAEVQGPGRFAGCVLNVDSQSDQWWGEGDNIVWLDDTNMPAIHGTGTEDYFGFAWCSGTVFNHPLRGQTSVSRRGGHWLSTMHRYHLLDQVPFEKWGRFQFQAFGLGNGEMDWKTTAIWYSQMRTRP